MFSKKLNCKELHYIYIKVSNSLRDIIDVFLFYLLAHPSYDELLLVGPLWGKILPFIS